MPKNLDDILKAKTAAAEAEKAERAAQEEAEVREGIEEELESLASSKQSLEILKESLDMERSGREKARSGKKGAESAIDAKSAKLEEVGLTKEQLLTDPEYADVQEVQDLKQATEEAGLYESPSAGSPELVAKLSSLGIEVSPDASEQEIASEVHARIAAIDREMIEKRLEIPGERERIAGELLEKYKLISPERLKQLSADIRVARNTSTTGTSVERTYERLEKELSSVRELESQPTLKDTVMEQYMRELVLEEERRKSEYEAEEKRNRTGDDRKHLNTPYDVYLDRQDALKRVVDAKASGEQPPYSEREIAYLQNEVASYESKLERISSQVGEYARLKREQQQQKPVFMSEGAEKYQRDQENLTKALAALAGNPGETTVRFDDEYYASSLNREKNARILLPDAEKKHTELVEQLKEKRAEKERAEQEVRALGPKPSGMFSGGAQKRWEAQKAEAESMVSRLGGQIEQMDADARNMTTHINLGSLPPEVIKQLQGRDNTTIADVTSLVREAVPSVQEQEREARTRERQAAELKEKLDRAGREQLTFY